MALLSRCCFRYSLRQGSFYSAVYTLIYFALFALLTGNHSFHELKKLYQHHEKDLLNSSLHQNDTATATGPAKAKVLSPSGLVLLGVDFTCEIFGLVASILLLRGLQLDRKLYLIPWLVVVPIHTFVDLLSLVDILVKLLTAEENINYAPQPQLQPHANSEEGDEDEINPIIVAGIAVTVDFVLNCINVYVVLCVCAQYQEYLEGRGTAAYEGVAWERPTGVVRFTISRGNGNGAGTNPCFSEGNDEGDKSDVCFEDLVLDKQRLPLGESGGGVGGQGRGDRRKPYKDTANTSTVRFDCDEMSDALTTRGNCESLNMKW